MAGGSQQQEPLRYQPGRDARWLLLRPWITIPRLIHVNEVKRSASSFASVMRAYHYMFNNNVDYSRLRERYERAATMVDDDVHRGLHVLLRMNRMIDESGAWIYMR